LHFIHQLNAKVSFNVTGHYTKGKGYYEEYKSNQLFTNYNMALPHLFLNDSTQVTTTDLVRRRWLDNDFAGGLFNFNYTVNSRLTVKLGGGYNSYFGRHFGRVVWAQYAASKEIDYEYYFNTANKNDGNLYFKTNYKPLSNLNVFVDLQVRKVNYRFLGFNALFENQIQNKMFVFFNPKLGLSYDLNKHINLYTSVSVANKEPNRNDFVENKPENRPKPEQLLDLEMGLNYSTKRIVAGLNFYNMQYKNQLVLNGQLNDVGASKRVNVDKSYRRGLEFELAINAGKYFSIGGNMALSQNKIERFVEFIDSSNADYSIYTQHKNEYKNTDISFSPNLVSSAVVSIRPIKNLEISFIDKHVGRQFLDNTSNTKRSINPYRTLDVQINYTIKTKLIPEITWMLSLYNVLSNTYETNGYTFSYYYDSAKLTTTNYLAPAAPFNFLGGVKFMFD
jgi:iron complex outermembrane recepter protein